MAVLFSHSGLLAPPSVPTFSPQRPKTSRPSPILTSASSSSPPIREADGNGWRKFLDFPFVSAPHRNLMVSVVSEVENRLQSELLPCTLPADVQFYQNQSGNAQGSLQVRSGHSSSHIDFILGSWLHCELPTGGALNITSLSAYLNSSTDAPNLLIELIQSSPTSLVLILDLPPRRDIVLHPDYLKAFYEDTQLDRHRQKVYQLPETIPYFSSSLYIRSVVSPTAILTSIATEAGGAERMKEIVENHVDPIAKEMVGIWLDQCACGVREVGESERDLLERRDRLMKSKTIEVDLGNSLPRLFGPEISQRVLAELRRLFNS